jgi:hypothetical protein
MEDILSGVRSSGVQESVEEKEREYSHEWTGLFFAYFSHLTAHCPLKRFAPTAQILLCAMLSLFTWFSH